MTQVKKYRIGTYIWVNGELVLKQYNRTYRGKPTKHIEDEIREELKQWFAYVITCLLMIGGYAVFSTSNYIVLEVEAEGVKSADVVVEDVAPEVIEIVEVAKAEEVKIEDLSVKERVLKVAEEKDFQYTSYLLRLIDCESKFNSNAVNTQGNTPKGSRDRGIMQISDYWHKEVSDEQAFDLEWSVSWAIDNINAGRQDMWSCDRIIKNK